MRQIAVFVPVEQTWTHPILQGIADYSPQSAWETFLPPTRPEDVALWLKEWSGDGIISAISDVASIRLLKRRRLPTVPPAGIILRQSTDAMAVGDLLIAGAIRCIRQNIAAITPQSLAGELATGRRTLERRFRLALRESIAQIIWRERVRLATTLLTTTKLSCYDISERCGFASASSLATVYRAYTQRSPTQVRDAAHAHT